MDNLSTYKELEEMVKKIALEKVVKDITEKVFEEYRNNKYCGFKKKNLKKLSKYSDKISYHFVNSILKK